MKRIWPVMMLVLLSAGCVTVPNSITPVAAPASSSDHVTLGMTHGMVSAIMNARVMVGYDVDPVTGVARPVEAQSLYSSEIVKSGGMMYRVDRYMVRSPAAGARIIEADLFPVVYKDGLVVAKGAEGLAQAVK